MTFQTSVATALPLVAPQQCPDTAAAILIVAQSLQPDLAQGFQIDALRLRLEMESAFGGSDAMGAWDWKLAYEAGEVALVLFLRKFGRALLARTGSLAALMPILAKVAGLLPTHTRQLWMDRVARGLTTMAGLDLRHFSQRGFLFDNRADDAMTVRLFNGMMDRRHRPNTG